MTPEVRRLRERYRRRDRGQFAALAFIVFFVGALFITMVITQLGCTTYAPGSGPAACGLP
jgi:hypothetical protein